MVATNTDSDIIYVIIIERLGATVTTGRDPKPGDDRKTIVNHEKRRSVYHLSGAFPLKI